MQRGGAVIVVMLALLAARPLEGAEPAPDAAAEAQRALEALVPAIDVPRAVGETVAWSAVGVHLRGVGGTQYGSGVLLEDGYILTAAHVVPCTDVLYAKPLSDQRRRKARVVALDDGLDLALLQIPLPKKTELRGIELAAEHPRRAAPVFGWGRETSIAAGQVVSGSELELLARIPMRPGDSGGPLLDLEGHLVGLLSRGVHTLPLATYVPLGEIREFLARSDRSATVSEADLCNRDRLLWSDVRDAKALAGDARLDTALLRLDQALARHPPAQLEARARVERAWLHQKAGHHEDALAELDAAVAGAPGLLDVQRRRVRVLLDLRRWDAALLAVAAIQELDPGDRDVWRWRFAAQNHLGTLEDAFAALDAYVSGAQGPAYMEALAVRCAASSQGDPKAAATDCAAAIALGFEQDWMHLLLAEHHTAQGRYPAGVDSYLRALALGSGHPPTARACARLLVVLGRDADAITMLTGVPLDDEARWTAVVAGARLGRAEFVATQLERASTEAKRPERFDALAQHLAAGGALGAATVQGQVELLPLK